MPTHPLVSGYTPPAAQPKYHRYMWRKSLENTERAMANPLPSESAAAMRGPAYQKGMSEINKAWWNPFSGMKRRALERTAKGFGSEQYRKDINFINTGSETGKRPWYYGGWEGRPLDWKMDMLRERRSGFLGWNRRSGLAEAEAVRRLMNESGMGQDPIRLQSLLNTPMTGAR